MIFIRNSIDLGGVPENKFKDESYSSRIGI